MADPRDKWYGISFAVALGIFYKEWRPADTFVMSKKKYAFMQQCNTI